MSAAVTDEMISAAQAGDDAAMWDVVTAHNGMIHGIIRSVAPGAKREDAEDLLQEARAVLVERIRSYDSTSSAAQLHTFAYAAVRRAVAEEWVRMTTGLTVDAGTALRVKRALFEFDGNTEAAYLMLHARYDTSRAVFLATLDALRAVEWLDAPQGEAGALTLAETIADPTVSVSDTVERRDLAHHLLDNMAVRRSYALRSFYGITMDKMDDESVAAHLQVKRGAVRLLRLRGIESAAEYASRHGIAA